MGSLGPATVSVVGDMTADRLRSKLKTSAVLTQDSKGYEAAIKRWTDTSEKKAGIVVFVQSAEDVSQTVLFCRDQKIPFVVAGGKHSSSGACSSEGGLVIDLAKMRHVTVDVANRTAVVEGGAIWEDVDVELGNHGLAGVGGTINHTGVGGLTLGGGYGWLSGRHGLTIDNLLSVKLVVADGRIVTASENENADLFWAIRGAGQSFGVTVEFMFRVHEQNNPIWAGQMVFAAELHLKAVVEFANQLVETTNGDSELVMGITAPPFMNEIAVAVTLFHNGPKEEAERIFAPLIALNPIKNSTAVRPYKEMNAVMNHAVQYGGRKSSKGAAFVTPISPAFVESLVDELKFFHHEVEGVKRSIILLEFFHTAKWMEVPASSMSFANRGDHQNAMVGPFWLTEENDVKCRRWSRHIAELFRAELERVREERGNPESMLNVGEYGNYDGLQENGRLIFKGNYDRLVELKRVWDADNLFNGSYISLV